jgi:hypothetical protein
MTRSNRSSSVGSPEDFKKELEKSEQRMLSKLSSVSDSVIKLSGEVKSSIDDVSSTMDADNRAFESKLGHVSDSVARLESGVGCVGADVNEGVSEIKKGIAATAAIGVLTNQAVHDLAEAGGLKPGIGAVPVQSSFATPSKVKLLAGYFDDKGSFVDHESFASQYEAMSVDEKNSAVRATWATISATARRPTRRLRRPALRRMAPLRKVSSRDTTSANSLRTAFVTSVAAPTRQCGAASGSSNPRSPSH